MNPDQKLKRIVIKEELVALTGDWLSAIVLNQFLYWGERVRDHDLFIQEELDRDPTANIPLRHGWIYKSISELREELMVDQSIATIRRRIQEITERGWLEERQNPRHAWDHTIQYRPNLRNIKADLAVLGYALDSYPLLRTSLPDNEASALHHEASMLHGEGSMLHGEGTIPEITAEITAEKAAAAPPIPQEPLADGFARALTQYENAFGILGGALKYDQFKQLWADYPLLEMHDYARGEMRKSAKRPNLAYYAKCLATVADRDYVWMETDDGIPQEDPPGNGRRSPPGGR